MTLAFVTAAAFFLATAGLVLLGLVSWRRTARLRRGDLGGRAPPGPASISTSWVTRIAGWAGVAAFAWGASVAPFGLAMLAGGAFVAFTGFRSRVTRIETGPHGVTVAFALKPPFHLSWPDLVAVRPPRTPLGGWRLVGRGIGRTLMASDLWGHEDLLRVAVAAAGLDFGGGRWARSV